MVAFVIFWAAVFAVIFFVVGIIFKALASAFQAVLTSTGYILAIGGLTTLAMMVLYLLYAVIEGIVNDGFLKTLGTIVLLVILLVIAGAILGGLGAFIFNIIYTIMSWIINIIANILEWCADKCERGYIRSLTAIVKRLDRC